jgi:hypothetical protein
VDSPRDGKTYQPGVLRARFTCASRGAGIALCKGAVDGGASTIDDRARIRLTPGSHVFTVRAVDEHGKSRVDRVRYRVNSPSKDLPPVVTIAEPRHGYVYTTDHPPRAEFKCGDDRGLRMCRATLSGDALPTPRSVDIGELLPTDEGRYRLVVEAEDAKGRTDRNESNYTIRLPPVTLTVEFSGQTGELRVRGDLECEGGQSPCHRQFALGATVSLRAESRTGGAWGPQEVVWENCGPSEEVSASCSLTVSEDVIVRITPKPDAGAG